MPFIYNNKEYKLVNDDGEWNKLDFVIARKLRVVYNEKITLDLVKKSFAVYGQIEKIEIFAVNSSDAQFTHVTFKDSRTTYLALIDCKQHPPHNIKRIRPADVHQQPDNPIDLSMSPFYNLPEKCLLTIFRYCDITSLATLSVVCKRMYQLLRDHVFSNKDKLKFDTGPLGNIYVIDALVTVSRLVQCMGPKTFHIKIKRSIHRFNWPSVDVDFDSSEGNKLSVDMSFYKAEWLCALDSIATFIHSVFIQRTIYDANVPYNGSGKLSWPNVRLLIMRGFSTKKSVPDFASLVTAMPNVETIVIQNLLLKMDLKSLCTRSLKKIYFENCSFKSDISKDQIFQLANHVKAQQGTNFPLCLLFDRIQYLRQQHVTCPIQFGGYVDEDDTDDEAENIEYYKYEFKEPEHISTVQESTYSDTMMALKNESVCKYLYIEIGKLYCGDK